MKKLSAIIIFFLLVMNLTSSAQSRENKPNVIFIIADDVGYGDLSCYGATRLHTPNLDRLAVEVRMFTDAHSASAVCTPSRYALLTGRYPFRANDGKGVLGPLPRDNKLIIDTTRLTLAKLMKDQGYVNACSGKWHLGFGEERPTYWNKPLRPGPLQLGFDYYFSVPFVNSGPPYVYVENEQVVRLDSDDPLDQNGKPVSPTQQYPDKSPNTFSGGLKAHQLYKDDEVGITLAGKSVEWIKEHKDHPFSPNERFKGTSECGKYGDFVHELDWIVGQVMQVLDEENLIGNTLLIFTSDNGGMLNVGGQQAWMAGHRMNGELLGFKFDAWEGGNRVPFIARWPGKIEPGSKSDQLLSNIDLMATLAALTGYQLQEGEATNSYNMLPALMGNPGEMVRDHLVIAPFQSENLALRMGKWVYIGARAGGGWSGGKPGDHILGGPAALEFTGEKNSDIEDGAFKSDVPNEQLYNLEEDLSQSTNRVEEEPGIARRLRTTLRLIRQTKYSRSGK